MKKGLLLGFAICYLLGAVAEWRCSRDLSFVTERGAVFFGVTWLPSKLLPVKAAMAVTPAWAWRPAR